jgi:hypothetical protein
MPNPFPGMNPYLERSYLWENIHNTFLLELRSALQPAIRPRYFVGMEHGVYIHEMPEDRYLRFAKPDLAVMKRQQDRPAASGATSTLEAPARLIIPQAVEEIRIPYLEIIDVKKNRVVTAIEVLSPTNKSGMDREVYLAKRHAYMKSEANFVEIDLLRRGDRMPVEGLPECASCIVVSRVSQRPQADVWPVKLRDRLPIIPIPLSERDAEVPLDLQEILNRVYDAGAFDLQIYSDDPDPPMSVEDAAWAKSLVPAEV